MSAHCKQREREGENDSAEARSKPSHSWSLVAAGALTIDAAKYKVQALVNSGMKAQTRNKGRLNAIPGRTRGQGTCNPEQSRVGTKTSEFVLIAVVWLQLPSPPQADHVESSAALRDAV